jgi:hypothetical protein
MWYLINMFYTTDPWVGVFLIVSRLLHQLVVDFSNHKWVDSRVTRPEPRLGCVQLLHIWAWLETSLWNKQCFHLHLKVPTLGFDSGWHFCLIKAFSHNCVFSVVKCNFHRSTCQCRLVVVDTFFLFRGQKLNWIESYTHNLVTAWMRRLMPLSAICLECANPTSWLKLKSSPTVLEMLQKLNDDANVLCNFSTSRTTVVIAQLRYNLLTKTISTLNNSFILD